MYQFQNNVALRKKVKHLAKLFIIDTVFERHDMHTLQFSLPLVNATKSLKLRCQKGEREKLDHVVAVYISYTLIFIFSIFYIFYISCLLHKERRSCSMVPCCKQSWQAANNSCNYEGKANISMHAHNVVAHFR